MDWLVLGGSIAGVLLLVLVAWVLGLGGATIADEAEARRIAEQAESGFIAERAFVSADARTALVSGRDGSFVLLKVHGAQVAARRLAPPLQVALEATGVRVATGERMFGDVRLNLTLADRDKLLDMV